MQIFTGPITLRKIFMHQNNWSRYLAWQKGEVRLTERENVRRMLSCRTPKLGMHLYGCSDCGTARVVPHSCKSRFCSACGKAHTDTWSKEILSDWLDMKYRHLIFTLPWQLRMPIKDNRKVLLNMLFRALGDAVLALTLGTPEPLCRAGKKRLRAMSPKRKYRPGLMAVVHTAGSDLKWNVHFHVIITCGGLSEDGQRFIKAPARSLVSGVELAQEWRSRVIAGLRKAEAEGPLIKRPLKKDPSRTIEIEPMIAVIKRLKWQVRICQATENAEETMKYCVRYTKRPALAEYRITAYDGQKVSFRYKDYYQGGERRFLTTKTLSFIWRIVQHIPEKHARHVRYYGMFSNRRRGQDLPLARTILGQRKKRKTKPETWEDRRKQSGESKPLSCPNCKGLMYLIAIVFGAPSSIARLLGIAVDEQIPTPCYVNIPQAVRTPIPTSRHKSSDLGEPEERPPNKQPSQAHFHVSINNYISPN